RSPADRIANAEVSGLVRRSPSRLEGGRAASRVHATLKVEGARPPWARPPARSEHHVDEGRDLLLLLPALFDLGVLPRKRGELVGQQRQLVASLLLPHRAQCP